MPSGANGVVVDEGGDGAITGDEPEPPAAAPLASAVTATGTAAAVPAIARSLAWAAPCSQLLSSARACSTASSTSAASARHRQGSLGGTFTAPAIDLPPMFALLRIRSM